MGLRTVAAAAVATAAGAAGGRNPNHRLYGWGIIGNAPTGERYQVANISVVDSTISWGAPLIFSSDSGCNVAFGLENGTAPVYYAIAGSMEDPPPQKYSYITLTPDGDVVRHVNASKSYSAPFVAYDPAARAVVGLGAPPLTADPEGVFQFDPVTGATTLDEANLTLVQEMPFCVGASSAKGRDGYFYFINGVIQKTNAQQLVTFDVAARNVTNVVLYPDGLISAIAGWATPAGADAVIALLWPNTGKPSLVQLDPHSPTWAPTTLYTFPGAQTPLQGVLTVIDTTAYALLNANDGPGTHLLFSADFGSSPPAVAMTPIDDSHAFFGVWTLGGYNAGA